MPDPKPLSPAQTALTEILGPLDGAQIPGGCDDCNAYQEAIPAAPGVWIIGVFHDDWCPTLARIATGKGVRDA
jgi:hypothetical protein